eukprot:jgi/Galph1/5257/GphlegSOOS_G3843.1
MDLCGKLEKCYSPVCRPDRLTAHITRTDPEQFYSQIKMRAGVFIKVVRGVLNIPSNQLAVSFQLRTVGGVVRPYNDFFSIIRKLCGQANIFFIVVGKSEELQFISLSPLEQHSIQKHLEKSPTLPPDRRYVSEVLCNENFSIAQLAELLLEYTGGVPGLMAPAISLLLEYVGKKGNSCISREECLALLKDRHVQQLCV